MKPPDYSHIPPEIFEGCCAQPDIAIMDHWHCPINSPLDRSPRLNRCCTRCFEHWYARGRGPVRRFSRKAWATVQRVAMEADARDGREVDCG